MPSFNELIPNASAARKAVAVVMFAICALPQAHGAAVSGQGTWETTLQGRDLDGDLTNGYEAYYDESLNVTWLADANYAFTTGYTSAANGGVERGSAYGNNLKWTDGAMGWEEQLAWAATLNVNGVTGWRLPTMVDTGEPGCVATDGYFECGYNLDLRTSELAHLFISTLGNKQYYDASGSMQAGYGLTNTGPFKNVGFDGYWTNVAYPQYPYGDVAWFFSSHDIDQYYNSKNYPLFAWAVHDGDVAAAVPEPQTYALAFAGLVVAVFAGRKRLKE